MRCLFIFIAFISTINAHSDDYNWALAKEDKALQIRVFTSKVAHSKLAAFRGEMLVKEQLWRLLALLNDSEKAPMWLHNCELVRLIEQKNDNQATYYSITHAPWPLLNRDLVSLVSTHIDDNSGIVTLNIQAQKNRLPKQKNRVRIPMLKGFWQFIPMPKQQIKIIYQIHADPGGDIPAWLANAVVVDTPYHSLKNMRKMLQTNNFKQSVPALMQARQKTIKQP